MKIYIKYALSLVMTTLFSVSAFGYQLGGDIAFRLGHSLTIESPYFLAPDGSKKLINIFSLLSDDDNKGVGAIFCANILGLTVNQITSAEVGLGIGDGMLYSKTTDSFSPVPIPNIFYNSVERLSCHSQSLPFVMLGGSITNLPGGPVRIDQPTMEYRSNSYSVRLLKEYSEHTICKYLGYAAPLAVGFVYTPANTVQTILEMLFTDPHIGARLFTSKGGSVKILDSITCH